MFCVFVYLVTCVLGLLCTCGLVKLFMCELLNYVHVWTIKLCTCGFVYLYAWLPVSLCIYVLVYFCTFLLVYFCTCVLYTQTSKTNPVESRRDQRWDCRSMFLLVHRTWWLVLSATLWLCQEERRWSHYLLTNQTTNEFTSGISSMISCQ